jgi:hypothetical protein
MDSMLFDSDHVIATMVCEDNGCKITVDLMTRGDVDIYYKGNRYRRACEFPKSLKKLIETDSEWFNNEDVEIVDNNWFEYIYDVVGDGVSYSDGIMFEDDLSTYTVEQLKEDMMQIYNYVAREV